ncbi:PepSY-associated TM helix domain-containing protein [Methylocystis parvus]|uniref:PepSY-associated TM helix domain-containing protein n=1 Tax=Methylocystis parvus TaxID=134 RepID=UPI003C73BB93
MSDKLFAPNPKLRDAGDLNRNRRDRLKARRKFWLDIHLYIGLVAGAMLTVIGVTGAIMVFYQEIDEILDPAMFVSKAPPQGEVAFLPLRDIRLSLEAAVPQGAKLGGIRAPRNERGCYKAYYEPVPERDTWRLCIDPYTAKVLGNKIYWSKSGFLHHSFMSFLFQLHWSLLFYDSFGEPGVVVGITAILLVVSVLSGLYLWWPTPGKWVSSFTLKRGARGERLNYDLHKLGGLYTAVVMLSVLISGVSMNLHDQFVWVVDHVAPLSAAERGLIKSSEPRGRARMPFEEAEAYARARYPQGRLDEIVFPEDERGVYQVVRKGVDEVSRFVGTRVVLVDQYSGETLGVKDPQTGTAGDVFMQWQWPLHSGQAFGWTGRILVMITGLICPLLFVTGVIRWLQKRAARRTHAERRARSRAPTSGAI